MNRSVIDRDAVAADPRHYSADEITRDGQPILIRAIRPDDKSRLREHFHSLSEQSVYFRFMGIKRDLDVDDLRRLTELDFDTAVGLVATFPADSVGRIIGVGRYARGVDSRRAEVAFAILDSHQGRGIGTLLLKHLGVIARRAGIIEFTADVLGDNRRMLEVFENSGFKIRRIFDSGVVHVRLPMGEADSRSTASPKPR